MSKLTDVVRRLVSKPQRFYGDGATVHSTNHLDVEVYNGKVVAVWYRCMMLPFEEVKVSPSRAQEMCTALHSIGLPKITGIILE